MSMEINKKRCVIYIPPEKHRDIAIRSAEEGVSINQFILSKIYKKRRWTGNLGRNNPRKDSPARSASVESRPLFIEHQNSCSTGTSPLKCYTARQGEITGMAGKKGRR